MAVQMRMFEEVRGNKLGEYTSAVPAVEFDHNPAESMVKIPERNPAHASADELLPIPARSIPVISNSNVSPRHPNPYDPASHASAWAKIRAFFMNGFQG